MNDRGRAGFSLVELLIVAVLGALVVLAAYQTLITSQRTFSQQGQTIQHNQTLRAGLEVISGELREISAQGQDIVGMGTDSIRVRVMRSFGLTCSWTFGTPSTFTVMKLGKWFASGDSVLVFADGDPDTSEDDQWLAGLASSVDTTSVTCASGDSAQTVTATVSGLTSALQVLTGAPLRNFTHYWYGSFTEAGETYFGRRAGSGGTKEPLVGPLKAGEGISFTYMDAAGNTVTAPSGVRQIRVVFRVQSDLLDNQGNPLTDSIVSRIYARN
ncbi:MAG: prepilin-type N-terminal cleavage/methylation domain-containing protein [Gemmatimonadetes bacterium]|nr:prepilin-type N-terminal cleavage/methylation domain-containing protein [Gemmatimonadota bacterium]